jgi:hypothetical protein
MKTAFSSLDRLFDPANPFLTAEGARMLAELRTDPLEEARMEALAAKANEGTLTPEERREYESWVRSGSVMSILQAQARLYLRRQAKAA